MPNSDGVVTVNPSSYDTRTSGIVLDNVTGLMWQQPNSSQLFTFAGAIAYCSSLSLGGYVDWRLPNEIELISLLDDSGGSYLNLAAFPPSAGGGSPYQWTWSASPVVGYPDYAWGVDFTYGYSDTSNASSTNGVRCVR